MDKFNNYLDEIKIEETCLKFLKTELKKEYSFVSFSSMITLLFKKTGKPQYVCSLPVPLSFLICS